MIWSGLWIYWANDVYRLGVGSFTLFKLFPEGFYRTFGVSHQLAKGMAWHFFFLWLFALNGVGYVAYLVLRKMAAPGSQPAIFPRGHPRGPARSPIVGGKATGPEIQREQITGCVPSLLGLIAEGKVKLFADNTFPLTEVKKAFEALSKQAHHRQGGFDSVIKE